MNIISK